MPTSLERTARETLQDRCWNKELLTWTRSQLSHWHSPLAQGQG